MNSQGRNNLLAAAVATVLGTGAAHALGPSATYNYTFYAAGGSAQEDAAYVAVSGLLQPSTMDVYTDTNTTVASGNYLIVTGTTNTVGSAALGVGTTPENVLFFYKFNGGSFPNGVAPQYYAAGTASSQLAYPQISSFATAVTTGAAAASPPNPNTPTYTFTAVDTNSQSPDWGLSDEEVSLFNYTNNLNGVAPLANITTNIATDGIYDDVFGVAITAALYNGTTGFPHPKTNFTKQEVQGILGGAVQNWNQLFADDGTQMPNLPLWLLDRGSGSGSKAAGNQYFLNYPGAIDSGGALNPHSVTPSGVNAGYTDTVLNLSGGYQDVKEASNAAIVTDLSNANNNAANPYAVAILVTEFAPAYNQNGKGSNQYAFAKINGTGIDTGGATDNINGTTSTSYTNVVTGAYDFVFQNSFNSRKNAPLTSTAAGALWEAAVKTQLQKETLAGANAGVAFPKAVTGILIDPGVAAAQDGGVIMWYRNKISTSPDQINFDATTVNTVAGKQVITYGSDPL
jgi:hypothetical protein